MTFKEAVAAAPPPVDAGYQPGKQALEGKHRRMVDCADPQRLTGSLNLDAALVREPGYANQPRWDYGLGHRTESGAECAVWVEVHSATTSEVSKVLRKLEWLRDWLNTEAEELRQLTTTANGPRFVWVASGRIHIPNHMPQARKLSMSPLGKPLKHLSLP